MKAVLEQVRHAGSWDPATLPHPKSSRLVRFRKNVVTSVTDATPLAQMVYQARCEVTDVRITQPSKVAISSGHSCMAVLGVGGWKNRDPKLQCHLLDEGDHMGTEVCFSPGLAEVAYTIALDEDRKLIFIGDSDRVKSYSWDAKVEKYRGSLPAVHTLDSDRVSGPLSILPNGRIIRAGLGKAIVWTIDDLPQHGPKGKRIGRGKYSTDHSWRDQDGCDEIETSTGTKRQSTLAFADKKCSPMVWKHHAPTGNLITGTNGRRDSDGIYECIAIDLEHGGKCAQRYLGHGGDVEDISISEGDGSVFATAASDGYARLFDVRQPLPVITFNHGAHSEFCPAVVLAHPDGVPTSFTGGEKSEQIKMWDVRGRKTVYELATGNNKVVSMAWDPKRSALYAATECIYMGRMGSHHDYRKARIPRWAHRQPMVDSDAAEEGEDEEDDDDDDDDLDDDKRYWPDHAYHGEDHFGYAFDSGDHRLYRYAFKEDPDTTVLPEYGEAGEADMHDSYW
ncbi:hypothetical protein FOMPIDRAFT_1120657 [Fomitopsis schrenkii]|uniref:Uncharacterized protein n=1 Tax=Fomitopsis schrenkii TaxID=2126942 RepID=S8FIW4_FOMSC|nr:hypothetical protein FOMPIDRAFT_1120657 [Fomitopsis schrenkii]